MFTADTIDFFASHPWWSRSGSATCQPVRYTGLSEVIGSWKIIAISLPRTSRISSSVFLVRSWPLNTTLPLTILPGRCSRMMLNAVTDFPHPDSPTMPSVSPGWSSNETPSTALTVPSVVLKTVCRSLTSRRGCVNSGLQTGIERIPDRVAEDVGGEDRDEDHDAWEVDQPGGVIEVALGLGQHVAPAGGRRLDAQAEEVEGRLDQDDLADAQAGRDDQHGQHVGQKVPEHHPEVAPSDRARGQDEVALLHRKDLATHQARNAAPSDRRDDRGQRDRGRVDEDRHQDEEEDRGDREDGVDESHQDVVDTAS